MPLLLLDLDNTLVDRAAAFERWAISYVSNVGGCAEDVGWLIQTDADGYQDREEVAAEVAERFRLGATARASLLEVLRAGLVEEMQLEEGLTARSCTRARWAGRSSP